MENKQFMHSYHIGLIRFWLVGGVKGNNNFVTIEEPNTLLGILPVGVFSTKTPVNQISSVDRDNHINIIKLIIGIILAWFFGEAMFSGAKDAVLAVPLFLFSVLFALGAFTNEIIIQKTSGDFVPLTLNIFEVRKIASIINDIESVIGLRMDDTNNRVHTDRIIDTIKNSKIYDNSEDNLEFENDSTGSTENIESELKKLIDNGQMRIKKQKNENGKTSINWIFNGINKGDKNYYINTLNNNKQLRNLILEYYKN